MKEVASHVPYDAFISYPRVKFSVVKALKFSLQKFVRSSNYPKSLHIFFDDDKLVPTQDLSKELKDAISGSNYFILIACPEAVASNWVAKELQYFYEAKGSTQNVIVILLDGDIAWDAQLQKFDNNKTTALPGLDKNIFNTEPFYISMKGLDTAKELSLLNKIFLNIVGSISARILNKQKDELIGDYIDELTSLYRRQRGNQIVKSLLIIVVGWIAMIILSGNVFDEVHPFVSIPLQCFILGFLAATITGLNIKSSLSLALAFGIIAVVYLWTTIQSFNSNTWDSVIQLCIGVFGYWLAGKMAGITDKKIRGTINYATLSAAAVVYITWLFTMQFMSYKAAVRIYRPEWFFTRLNLTLKAFDPEMQLLGVNPFINLTFLSVSLIIVGVFYIVLHTGSEFQLVNTTERNLKHKFHQFTHSKWKNRLFAIPVLLIVFVCYNLIYFPSNTPKNDFNRTSFDTDNVKSDSESDGNTSPDYDNVETPSRIMLENKVSNALSIATTAFSKNDTAGTWNILAELNALNASQIDSLNLQLVEKVALAFIMTGHFPEAERFINVILSDFIQKARKNEDGRITFFTTLARNNQWEVLLHMLQTHKFLASPSMLFELSRVGSRLDVLPIRQQLKIYVYRNLENVEGQVEANAFSRESDFVNYVLCYIQFGDTDLAKRLISAYSSKAFHLSAESYLHLAKNYNEKDAYREANEALQMAWYYIHQQRSRYGFYGFDRAEMLREISSELYRLKRYKHAKLVKEEAEAGSIEANYH